MDHVDVYHVWRRSDGYVGASNGSKPTAMPNHTFEHLLTTEDWAEAHALIVKERKKNPSFWLH